jgi:glycosyltransferase involved in cell wall biosynthesis
LKANSKHIILLTPGFPSSELDDTCIPALQIFAKKLQEEGGIKVSVIAVHYPFTSATYRWNHCDVYPLGIRNKKRNSLKSYLQQWKFLKRIHKEEPIDVIHSFWLGECALIGHYFSKKHQIKHLTTFMGQDARKGNKYAYLLPLQQMKLISLSDFHQNKIKNNYGIETTIIPWGLDENSTIISEEKTIDIIGVGSLIPLKKYSEFVTCINELKKVLPNIKSVIIGEGKLYTELKQQIKSLQLENHIELKGAVSYHDTQIYISKAKVLLHPSIYESFGMVFAEAIACKTAIVSRKVGFAESTEHWFLGNNPEEFVNGCLTLLQKKDSFQSSYPAIKKTVVSYLKVYEQ